MPTTDTPPTVAQQLTGDIATLNAVSRALAGCDAPQLLTRYLHDDGGRFIPHLTARPLTALLRVVENLGVVEGMDVEVFVRHRPSPAGTGSEVYATAKLEGRAVEFVVQTWRFGPDTDEQITTARNGLISLEYLRELAGREEPVVALTAGPDPVPAPGPATPPKSPPTREFPAREVEVPA